jgi:hypothetical protein
MRKHTISIIGTKSSGKTKFFDFLLTGKYDQLCCPPSDPDSCFEENEEKGVNSCLVVVSSETDTYHLEFYDGDVEGIEGYIVFYDVDSVAQLSGVIEGIDKPMVFVRNKQDYFDSRNSSPFEPNIDYSVREEDNPSPILKKIIEKISKKIIRGRLKIIKREEL